jgi:hypothetical protein
MGARSKASWRFRWAEKSLASAVVCGSTPRFAGRHFGVPLGQFGFQLTLLSGHLQMLPLQIALSGADFLGKRLNLRKLVRLTKVGVLPNKSNSRQVADEWGRMSIDPKRKQQNEANEKGMRCRAHYLQKLILLLISFHDLIQIHAHGGNDESVCCCWGSW